MAVADDLDGGGLEDGDLGERHAVEVGLELGLCGRVRARADGAVGDDEPGGVVGGEEGRGVSMEVGGLDGGVLVEDRLAVGRVIGVGTGGGQGDQ